MLVVMQEGAEEAQIQSVINRLVGMGFTVHRSTGVRHTVLGGVGPVDDFDPADFEEGIDNPYLPMPSHRLPIQAGKPLFQARRHCREDWRYRNRRKQSGHDGGAVQR